MKLFSRVFSVLLSFAFSFKSKHFQVFVWISWIVALSVRMLCFMKAQKTIPILACYNMLYHVYSFWCTSKSSMRDALNAIIKQYWNVPTYTTLYEIKRTPIHIFVFSFCLSFAFSFKSKHFQVFVWKKLQKRLHNYLRF